MDSPSGFAGPDGLGAIRAETEQFPAFYLPALGAEPRCLAGPRPQGPLRQDDGTSLSHDPVPRHRFRALVQGPDHGPDADAGLGGHLAVRPDLAAGNGFDASPDVRKDASGPRRGVQFPSVFGCHWSYTIAKYFLQGAA